MKWIAFLCLLCLSAHANANIIFEDERYKSEIIPLIHENFNNLNDSIHIIENSQQIVVISIVSTPTKLKDGRPKLLPDMLKITQSKGMSAISKFIETSISSQSEMLINSSSGTTQTGGNKSLESSFKNKVINEKILEQSSMVLVNSKAYAYWFTEDKMFFKRAVIFLL